MITLYYHPKTRAVRPLWLLEEMELPYELVQVDFSKGEHRSDEYRRVHPLGKVPAMRDEQGTLFESCAICLYLADKYIDKGFAPPFGSPSRGAYYQWMLYTMGTLEPRVIELFKQVANKREGQAIDKDVTKAWAALDDAVKVVATALGDSDYLVENRFSAADIMIGSILNWASMIRGEEGQPVVGRYLARLLARPACARALNPARP